MIRAASMACFIVVFTGTAAHADGLMIPDSGTGDRIMLFSDVDGSLIDANWITDAGGTFTFTTPKEAKVVGTEIWVSDQVADALIRFDLNRNFLGSITAHFNAGQLLDNLRGFGADATSVYVTCFHGTTLHRGIVVYNYAGTATGFFQAPVATSSLFDVGILAGNLLISNGTADAIQRYTSGGVFIDNFATGITEVQQSDVMPDGTVMGVSTIAVAGVEGVYHWNADGSLIRFIDTELLKGSFGEQVPRAAWLLQDGNYLIATSIGVYKYTVSSNSFSEILAGPNAQFINPIPLAACPADIDNSNMVDVNDLLAVINAWGPCPQPCPPSCQPDIEPDCAVDVNDLLTVINAWGPCP